MHGVQEVRYIHLRRQAHIGVCHFSEIIEVFPPGVGIHIYSYSFQHIIVSCLIMCIYYYPFAYISTQNKSAAAFTAADLLRNV